MKNILLFAMMSITITLAACTIKKVNITDGVDKYEATRLAFGHMNVRQAHPHPSVNRLQSPIDMGSHWKIRVYNAAIHRYMAFSILVDKKTGVVSEVINK